MTGDIGDEIWVYLVTDDEGQTGIAYWESAGGARIPMIAGSEADARLIRPIAEKLASIMGRAFTLVRFRDRTEISTLEPKVKDGGP